MTKAGVDHRRPPRTRRNSARRFSVAMAICCVRSPNDREVPQHAHLRQPRSPARRGSCPAGSARFRPALSRQALAALGATPRNDVTAADGRHAGAEAVPTLAHELARLIGPLHDTFSILASAAAPPTSCSWRLRRRDMSGAQRSRCNTNRRPRSSAWSPETVRPCLRMSAGLIWGPCGQVNRTALPKGPASGHSQPIVQLRADRLSRHQSGAFPHDLVSHGARSRHSRCGPLPGRERGDEMAVVPAGSCRRAGGWFFRCARPLLRTPAEKS